jgi:hypothetical protein
MGQDPDPDPEDLKSQIWILPKIVRIDNTDWKTIYNDEKLGSTVYSENIKHSL